MDLSCNGLAGYPWSWILFSEYFSILVKFVICIHSYCGACSYIAVLMFYSSVMNFDYLLFCDYIGSKINCFYTYVYVFSFWWWGGGLVFLF